MWCGWCNLPVRKQDDARRTPGVVYHEACWDRHCAEVGTTGPVLVVRGRPLTWREELRRQAALRPALVQFRADVEANLAQRRARRQAEAGAPTGSPETSSPKDA